MGLFRIKKNQKKKQKEQVEDLYEEDDDDETKDWWTKYFLSHEKLVEASRSSSTKVVDATSPGSVESKKLGISKSKIVQRISPKHTPKKTQNKNAAICDIYPNELESLPEYNYFKEWLLSFPLYRGKKTGDSVEDEHRIVGYFKGSIKVYRLPVEKGIEPAFTPTLPINDPMHVLGKLF